MTATSTSTGLLTRIWSQLDGLPEDLSRVAEGQHPIPLPARTDVASLAWASVAAASLAAARLSGSPAVRLSPERVAVAYSSERHFRIDGQSPSAFAPLSGFFRTTDGWVRTHGNYPHHAAALRGVLGLDETAEKDAAATAFSQRRSDEVSDAITRARGICVRVATESPHEDASLASTPLLRISRLSDAPGGKKLGQDPGAPLRGIRVLDLTRVIAGPIGTRTLALLGADVLRIDPPAIPEIGWQHLDTGHGKRSTQLDLRRPAHRDRFDELLSTADVVALGYRSAALDRLGLSPTALADRRPGIVVVRHSAWGTSDQRGFDSIVQARSGISWIESADGVVPGALPAQALDHSTGYLLAAAAITLLERRSREGGSWLAETSLRRMAAELLTLPRTADPEPAASGFDPDQHLQHFEVDGHRFTTTAPAIAYEGGPTEFASPRTWGADEPSWWERG